MAVLDFDCRSALMGTITVESKTENRSPKLTDLKIDLVMWTLNGEKTLRQCLASIERAIPKKCVGQKIVIDGHSTDNTKSICKSFGWRVLDSETVGISYQANQALDLVKTEFFASFEQDIVLHPDWLSMVIRHFEDESVAIAQGARYSMNPTVRNLELYAIDNQPRYTSLDNTIYRTSVIRELGGYNVRYPIVADRDLQDRVWAAGFKWIVDKSVSSDHLKFSIRKHAQKIYHDMKTDDYTRNSVGVMKMLRLFVTSPIRGTIAAYKTRCPSLCLLYPYFRLHWLLGCLR